MNEKWTKVFFFFFIFQYTKVNHHHEEEKASVVDANSAVTDTNLPEKNPLQILAGIDTTGEEDSQGRTPLHGAAGNVDNAKVLIECGADLKAEEDEHYQTPLHRAASKGQVEIVKALVVEFGVGVDANDDKGQ